MEQRIYLTTGEFAKAMGVTKNTLFHYDKIGLFSPDIVLENEYRYYSVYQMELFHTILVLKELGMSLTEIKNYLANRSPQKLQTIFSESEEKIETQMKNLAKQLAWIKQQSASLSYALAQDFSSISVISQPTRYYTYTSAAVNSEADFCRKTNELITALEQDSPDLFYEIAYMQKEENISRQIYDAYDNVLLLLQKKPRHIAYHTIPAGDFLTAYHTGHWNTIGDCYERLLTYAKKHHLKLDHYFWEYYAIDNLHTPDSDQYVTELSVRILEHPQF